MEKMLTPEENTAPIEYKNPPFVVKAESNIAPKVVEIRNNFVEIERHHVRRRKR